MQLRDGLSHKAMGIERGAECIERGAESFLYNTFEVDDFEYFNDKR